MNSLEINVSFNVKELADLEDFCQLGISMGPSLSKNTYVLKKLLFNLIKRLPADSSLTITDQSNGQEPFGFVYIEKENPSDDDVKQQEVD